MARPHCGIAPKKGEAVTLCDTRRVSIRTGEMLWDPAGRHWVFPVSPYALIKRIPGYGWDFCPFCGGEMPAPSKG
jgi:hypothetical protein